MKKRWGLIAKILSGLFVLAVFLIFNFNKDDGYEFIIGLSQPNLQEPWRVALNQEVKKNILAHNNINVIYKDAGGSIYNQKSDIKDLLECGIDLLIVSMTNNESLKEILEEAYSKVPVIIIESNHIGYDYSTFIGIDNELIGSNAAEIAIEVSNNENTNIVEIQGQFGSQPSIEMSLGFKQSLEKNEYKGKFTSVIGSWNRDEAEEKIFDILEGKSDELIIFAHSDDMALGAYKAIKRLNYDMSKIYIIGVGGLDGEYGGISLLEENIIQCTFKSESWGEEIVNSAVKILNNEEVERRRILKTNILRKF